jgi:hypothetical protein
MMVTELSSGGSVRSLSEWQACTFSYGKAGMSGAMYPGPPVIMVAFRDEAGRLNLLIHPEVRNMFEGGDLDYLDALIWDFVDRAKNRPDELIEQWSSLGNVGPLVISEFRADISSSSTFMEFKRGFVEL